jgi:hypothetical protein
MENTSITKSCFFIDSRVRPIVSSFLLLTLNLFSFSLSAQQIESNLQYSYLMPETPESPHFLHWQEQRSFALMFTSRDSTFDETNGDALAAFSEQEVLVDAVFQRKVSPSVVFSTSLSHVKADSTYASENAGITSDVDRKVRSSLGSVAGSYKIMDALVLALRLGYQVSQLEFSQSDVSSNRTFRLTPALAWKSTAVEIAAYQARIQQSKTTGTNKKEFVEQGLLLSSIESGSWQWQVWLQKNPQPVCCAFVDSKRSVIGGRVFLPWFGFTFSPGYRFLSEFQTHQQPGTVEDVARHNIFMGLSSHWNEWQPYLNMGIELPASESAPSSFGSSGASRSKVEARSFQFGAGLARAW